MGHSYLLTGDRSESLENLALGLAGQVLDAAPQEHPDFHSVRPESKSRHITVEQIRELERELYLRPYSAPLKVAVIFDAERMCLGSANAANAFLKTLEEPPDGVLFIFCTTDPSQIRPAVVSRLQRYTFRPLTVDEIGGKLDRILAAEGRTAEPDAVDLVARLAAGGMRDAESMLDQVLSNAEDPITATAIRDLLGLAENDAVDRFVDALATGDALTGITILDDLEADGKI